MLCCVILTKSALIPFTVSITKRDGEKELKRVFTYKKPLLFSTAVGPLSKQPVFKELKKGLENKSKNQL